MHVMERETQTKHHNKKESIFSEHHQDPPACMEFSLSDQQGEPGRESKGMVVENTSDGERAKNALVGEVEQDNVDNHAGMAQKHTISYFYGYNNLEL